MERAVRLLAFLARKAILAFVAAYLANRFLGWFLLPSTQVAFSVNGELLSPFSFFEHFLAKPFAFDQRKLPMMVFWTAFAFYLIFSLTKFDATGEKEKAKEHKGEEFGGARWATPAEIRQFAHTALKKRIKGRKYNIVTAALHNALVMPYNRFVYPIKYKYDATRVPWVREQWNGQVVDDPVPSWCLEIADDNYILSRGARMHASANPDRLFERNKHVYVVGGSGSGKTFNYVTPNLLNLNGSYFVTDPKGDTLKRFGNYMMAHGYKLKVIYTKDPANFAYSMHYNPLVYIRTQANIMTLVNVLIENTQGEGEQSQEDFFIKAERQLYCCLMCYVFYEYRELDPTKCTIPYILDMLKWAAPPTLPDGSLGQGPTVLDLLFHGKWNPNGKTKQERGFYGLEQKLLERYGGDEAAAKLDPEWFAITMYDGFKSTAGSPETQASVLASCNVRLAPFAMGALREMFSSDDMELDKLGEEKTAFFAVMSDTDKSFNFILAMLLYQLFDINVNIADANPGSHCKIPITFLLDEFPNIGRIPSLEVMIATLRSRWMNLHCIAQQINQIADKYGEKAAGIIRGNCDSFLYLGRSDDETNKQISESLGNYTILKTNRSESYAASGNSVSVSIDSKEMPLMAPTDFSDNPEKFNGDMCLVKFNNAHPILDDKYRSTEHPRYKEYEKAREFDLEQWAYERKIAAHEATVAELEELGRIQSELNDLFKGFEVSGWISETNGFVTTEPLTSEQ